MEHKISVIYDFGLWANNVWEPLRYKFLCLKDWMLFNSHLGNQEVIDIFLSL